jgi:hypothetical protein
MVYLQTDIQHPILVDTKSHAEFSMMLVTWSRPVLCLGYGLFSTDPFYVWTKQDSCPTTTHSLMRNLE